MLLVATMGNDQSRTLSDRQHRLDKKGLLHKTIGEIWEVDAQSFDGAFAKARLLRRGGNPKPEMKPDYSNIYHDSQPMGSSL